MTKTVTAVTFWLLTMTLSVSGGVKERVLMVGPWLEDGTIERNSNEARFLVALSETVLGHRYLDKMGYYSSPIALPDQTTESSSILDYEPKVDVFQNTLEFYTGSLKFKRSKLVYEKEVRGGVVILGFSSTHLIEGQDLHLFLTDTELQVLDYRLEPVSRNTSAKLEFDGEIGLLTVSFGPVAMAAGVDQRSKFRKSQILVNSEASKFDEMQPSASLNGGKLRE